MRIKEDTKSILIHIGLLIAATLPFWLTGLDIRAQSFFYDLVSRSWRFADMAVVKFLYNYGVYPALITAAAAIVLLGLGFAYGAFLKYRKAALLVILTLFLGPALFVNVILKSYTGRPRPREIKEFNGRADFKNVFELGTPGRGHSFPCGHASMGFLFTAFYFVFRKKNRAAAYLSLYGGLLYGSAMGAARMAQGAHFLSDVLWTAGITFISAEIAWYKILGGEGAGVFKGLKAEKKNRAVSLAAIAALLAALVFVFLFSVPYAADKQYGIKPQDKALELYIYTEGSVRVLQRESEYFISLKASGFGFPRRSFEGALSCSDTDKGQKCVFTAARKGFFSELNSTMDVYLPAAKEYYITVNTKKGDIECSLAGAAPLVALTTGRGGIDFKAGRKVRQVYMKTAKGDAEAVFDADAEMAAGTFIDVDVNGEFSLVNRAPFFREINEQGDKVTGSKELYFKSVKKDGPAMSVKARKIVIK